MLKITIFIFVLGIVALAVYYFVQKPTPKTTSTVSTVASTNYFEYSKSAFETASDKRRVLFFYAAWCPTCRPADADFKTNADKFPKDLVVFKVNYDTETSLKKKYGITYQHTFVQVDKEEKEIVKWNGGQTKELLEKIK